MTSTHSFRRREPQQRRSRETLERILDTVENMLDGRPFSEITIQGIVDTAGVSRSSFYARFPNKESLLQVMYERYINRASEMLDEALDVQPNSLASEELVERLVRAYLRFVVLLEPMVVSFDAGEMGGRHIATRDAVTNRVVSQYLRAIGREGDTALGLQVEFATRSIASILIRAVCQPSAFSERLGFDHERLVAETSRMASCYLGEAANRLPA